MGTFDIALRIWVIAAPFILAAVGLWVRSVAKDEVDLLRKEVRDMHSVALAAVRTHDENPHAHPNHHMTPVIQALQLEITKTLAEMKGDLKSVGNEVASLRRAHDDAVKNGLCLYQNLEDKRGDR